MFETVLVASRGPVARRVVATCQRLGIRAVSVHSEVDRAARHVTEADDSVLLGPAPPEQSYLDRRRVLEAARQCGASAVHPGAGALAQDPRFAKAVLDAGLAWAGAPPQVLERAAAGRPQSGGRPQPDGRPQPGELSRSGELPQPGELPRSGGLPGLQSGRSLAVHLLAGTTVVPLALLELTGGAAGNPVIATTLPAGDEPGLTSLLELGVRVAADAGLRGAGSVQLGPGPDGTARVVALRPSLPVEHPASELLHGLDLVEQQLRVADGQPAGEGPPASGVTGPTHALCLRIYAEDVGDGVRLERWRPPPDARVDSAAEEGDLVLPWYDPLLATLTVTGWSAAEVRERAGAAVRQLDVEGPRTNLPRLHDALTAAVRSEHERRDLA